MAKLLCTSEVTLNTAFRDNDMELIKGGVALPNVDEKGTS